MATKYRRIHLTFWTDLKVRQLKPLDKLVFLYLVTCPHSHLSGIYHLPILYACHETGLDGREVGEAFDRLKEAGLVQYNEKHEVVWVVNMLKYQVISYSTVVAVTNQLDSLHGCPLIETFSMRYGGMLREWKDRDGTVPTQCQGSGNKDQEKDQDQKKEKKKEKKQNKDIDHSFSLFWEAYPKKIGKAAAKKAWNKELSTLINDDLLETILKAIEMQIKSNQWRQDGGQFIPHPATWLNQERWEDGEDIDPPVSSTPINPRWEWKDPETGRRWERNLLEDRIALGNVDDSMLERLRKDRTEWDWNLDPSERRKEELEKQ